MLTVYSKNVCPYCVQAKNFLTLKNIPYQEINIEKDPVAKDFIVSQGHRTVPQIYMGNEIFVEEGWTGLSKMTDDEIQSKLPNQLGTQ